MKIDSGAHDLYRWHSLLATAALRTVHEIERADLRTALVRAVDLSARPVGLVELLHYPGELVQLRIDQEVVIVLAHSFRYFAFGGRRMVHVVQRLVRVIRSIVQIVQNHVVVRANRIGGQVEQMPAISAFEIALHSWSRLLCRRINWL